MDTEEYTFYLNEIRAKIKSDFVIELLKGKKDLNTLAVENNIQPNLLRNWKKEFLDDAVSRI